MPEVCNEDYSGFVSVVPSFMLEGVIENVSLAEHLFFSFIGYPQSTSFDSHQGHMKSKFLICWAVVLDNMSFLCNCAKKTVMVVSWQVFFDQLDGFRDFFAVDVKLHVVEHQIENVPVAGIVGLRADSILGFVFCHPAGATVRLETFLVPKRNEFVPNNIEVLLKMFNPGKFIGVPTYNCTYHQGWPLRPGKIYPQPFCHSC